MADRVATVCSRGPSTAHRAAAEGMEWPQRCYKDRLRGTSKNEASTGRTQVGLGGEGTSKSAIEHCTLSLPAWEAIAERRPCLSLLLVPVGYPARRRCEYQEWLAVRCCAIKLSACDRSYPAPDTCLDDPMPLLSSESMLPSCTLYLLQFSCLPMRSVCGPCLSASQSPVPSPRLNIQSND